MNAPCDKDLADGPADLPIAASWATGVMEDLERSGRRAWMVAIIAAIVAVLEAVALVFLIPLRTVEPYTLLVDRQTGHVEALAPLDAQVVAPDAALTRSFLVQYVIARESFAAASLQDEYRKVALWSDPKVAGQYQRMMAATNPVSPLAYLPRENTIRTQVKSVSTLGERRALVRFTTIQIAPNGAAAPAQHWAAFITYEFSRAQMSAADRYINPLGFQVTAYRRDAETIPEEGIVGGVKLDETRRLQP